MNETMKHGLIALVVCAMFICCLLWIVMEGGGDRHAQNENSPTASNNVLPVSMWSEDNDGYRNGSWMSFKATLNAAPVDERVKLLVAQVMCMHAEEDARMLQKGTADAFMTEVKTGKDNAIHDYKKYLFPIYDKADRKYDSITLVKDNGDGSQLRCTFAVNPFGKSAILFKGNFHPLQSAVLNANTGQDSVHGPLSPSPTTNDGKETSQPSQTNEDASIYAELQLQQKTQQDFMCRTQNICWGADAGFENDSPGFALAVTHCQNGLVQSGFFTQNLESYYDSHGGRVIRFTKWRGDAKVYDRTFGAPLEDGREVICITHEQPGHFRVEYSIGLPDPAEKTIEYSALDIENQQAILSLHY